MCWNAMKSWLISISETEFWSSSLRRRKGVRQSANTTADSKKMTKHFMHSSTPQASFPLGLCFNIKSMFYVYNLSLFLSLEHSTSISLHSSFLSLSLFLTLTLQCQIVHKIQGSVSCLKFSTSPQIHKYSRAEQKCYGDWGEVFCKKNNITFLSDYFRNIM